MPIVVLDHGTGNDVEIDPDVRSQSDGTIVLHGDDNQVVIGAGCTLQSARISLGQHCSLRVGRGSRLAALETMASREGRIVIGHGTNFTWATRLLMHEPGLISIGDGCLIASDTLLTVSDMHSIIDRETGQRINPAADIVIEDHVWLAHEVTVLKGCRIGEGSIVGIGSIVSRDLPRYSLAVGRPAGVIRQDVTWHQDLL